jgi:predicted CXXCH cytochrome family protein
MRINLTAACSRLPLLALLSVLVISLYPSGLSAQVTSVKVADAECARCHQEIFNKYLATPMANASGPASEKLFSGHYIQVSTGKDYAVAVAGKTATLSIQDQHNPSVASTRPLSYFLGSGHLGTTYLYSIDRFLFESPVAWYSDLHGYDMKPGLAEMKTVPPALPMQSGCLRCHMSAVQVSESGTLNQYKGEPFLHTGITCEACHGDAQKHVSAGGKGGVLNPTKLNPDQRDSICISCHLEGDITVERANHNPLDYRPGESISKYLAFYVYGGANPTSRGVSEVEQFAKSTCKRMSGDAMSCTSCHDPHFTPSVEQRTAFYRGKCLACHSDARFATAHHPENQDCTSCHMARTGAQNIPHVAWTDHRILKLPDSGSSVTAREAKDELAPIFSPGANTRDIGMANYTAMLDGDRSALSKAWTPLNSERTNIQNDAAALDALGVLTAQGADNTGAEALFRRVLILNPNDLTALSNLGILVARQGKLKEATALLQSAFDRNADVSGLAMNLARVQCAAGDAAAARITLQATLKYNPDLESVRRLMQDLSDCGKPDGR